MAVKSNFTGRNIPSLSTRKSAPVTTNFAKGIYTYKPNDTMDYDEIRLAQDARFDRVGTQLATTVKVYEETRNMLSETNQQSLLNRAARLKDLGAKTTR